MRKLSHQRIKTTFERLSNGLILMVSSRNVPEHPAGDDLHLKNAMQFSPHDLVQRLSGDGELTPYSRLLRLCRAYRCWNIDAIELAVEMIERDGFAAYEQFVLLNG